MVWFQRLAATAAVLAFVVITMGAWVRLTDAGLGCPDWPGCFGHLTVPESEQQLARVADTFGSVQVETGKAWREMIHRYAASTLGLLIVALAALGWRNRREPGQQVVLPFFLLGLVLFQGMLGMWTVTLKLQPLIVMGHLLGGMTILSLLVWLALTSRPGVVPRSGSSSSSSGLKALTAAALVVTFGQIALGGWTSTHYAALACPDFPTCQNEWWPQADWSEGFVPWRNIESNFEGGVLLHPARVAIHLTHRVGALLLTSLLLLGIWRVATRLGAAGQRAAALCGAALLGQIAIGVSIVKLGLPLWLGVAHNGNAALLLLGVLSLFYVARYHRA